MVDFRNRSPAAPRVRISTILTVAGARVEHRHAGFAVNFCRREQLLATRPRAGWRFDSASATLEGPAVFAAYPALAKGRRRVGGTLIDGDLTHVDDIGGGFDGQECPSYKRVLRRQCRQPGVD